MLIKAGRYVVNTEHICRVRKNEDPTTGAVSYQIFVRDGQSGMVVSGDVSTFEAWLNTSQTLRTGLDFIPVAGIASIVKISVPTDGASSTHYHIVIAGYQHPIKIMGTAIEPFEAWLARSLGEVSFPAKDGKTAAPKKVAVAVGE